MRVKLVLGRFFLDEGEVGVGEILVMRVKVLGRVGGRGDGVGEG